MNQNDTSSEWTNETSAQLEQMSSHMKDTSQKDIEILKDLNNSVSNSIRKEYIGMCIEDLEKLNVLGDKINETNSIVNDMTNNKISVSEGTSKLTTLEKEVTQITIEANDLEKKIEDFEKEHSDELLIENT